MESKLNKSELKQDGLCEVIEKFKNIPLTLRHINLLSLFFESNFSMSSMSDEALPDSEPMSLDVISNSEVFEESECSFDDCTYGEALLPHRVVLDFTPNELDNDFVQRKCCAFWNFINSRPELKDLCAIPDRCDDSDVSEVSSEPDCLRSNDYKPVLPDSTKNQEKTAVDMLEFVEEKGLIDRAFEARLPKLHCEFDLVSYSNDTSVSKGSPTSRSTSSKPLKQNKQTKKTDNITSPKLKKFCKKMQNWDVDHPKSMDPPGPPPVLTADIKLI